MGITKWLLGAGAAAAATEYGIARYFFRRTMIKENASSERTQDMAGTDWALYIPKIKENSEWLSTLPMESVSIPSRDGLKLSGTWIPCELPEKDEISSKTVICFHGYSSKGMTDYASLGRFYHDLGFNLLIVDARAHGNSEGTYIGFGCLDRFDALAWIRYVEQRFGANHKVLLHGVSMGGATVLMTSGLKLPSCVKAIVSDCAFTSAWDVFTSVLKTTYHMPAFPILHIANEMTKQKAGYGLNDCSGAEEVKKAKVPILFVHGTADTFVPCRMCYEMYHNCASPKEIFIVQGAGHAESYYKETAAFETRVKSFLVKGALL